MPFETRTQLSRPYESIQHVFMAHVEKKKWKLLSHEGEGQQISLAPLAELLSCPMPSVGQQEKGWGRK